MHHESILYLAYFFLLPSLWSFHRLWSHCTPCSIDKTAIILFSTLAVGSSCRVFEIIMANHYMTNIQNMTNSKTQVHAHWPFSICLVITIGSGFILTVFLLIVVKWSDMISIVYNDRSSSWTSPYLILCLTTVLYMMQCLATIYPTATWSYDMYVVASIGLLIVVMGCCIMVPIYSSHMRRILMSASVEANRRTRNIWKLTMVTMFYFIVQMIIHVVFLVQVASTDEQQVDYCANVICNSKYRNRETLMGWYWTLQRILEWCAVCSVLAVLPVKPTSSSNASGYQTID